MLRTPAPGSVALLLACCLVAPFDATSQTTAVAIDAEPVPGQLDVLQGTAVKLGGAPPVGAAQPERYRWEIVQGKGGALYDADQAEAIFQAPAVADELELFVIRLTVEYPGQAAASTTVHIRVHREAAAAGEPERSIEDIMTDYYRKEKEAREQRRSAVSEQPVVIHQGYGYRGFHGVGWGWGAGWGWPAAYPVYAPVVVAPPGVHWRPGEGSWREPIAIPYDDMVSTFPESISSRYGPEDDPNAGPETPAPVAPPAP